MHIFYLHVETEWKLECIHMFVDVLVFQNVHMYDSLCCVYQGEDETLRVCVSISIYTCARLGRI